MNNRNPRCPRVLSLPTGTHCSSHAERTIPPIMTEPRLLPLFLDHPEQALSPGPLMAAV
jgi:hypothetical protein